MWGNEHKNFRLEFFDFRNGCSSILLVKRKCQKRFLSLTHGVLGPTVSRFYYLTPIHISDTAGYVITSISAFLVGVQKQSTKLQFLLTLSRSIVPCGEQNKK